MKHLSTILEVIRTKYFDKWLAKLKDFRAGYIIADRIIRIEEKGDFGDYHSVGGYVSELRIDYGAGYRIYFTKKGDEIVILLAGGTKKRQSDDIKKAQEIAKEWRIKNG